MGNIIYFNRRFEDKSVLSSPRPFYPLGSLIDEKYIKDNPIGSLLDKNLNNVDLHGYAYVFIKEEVCAMVAKEKLKPGEKVNVSQATQFNNDNMFYEINRGQYSISKGHIGIVDPFLKEDVLPGQMFWMILSENCVKG